MVYRENSAGPLQGGGDVERRGVGDGLGGDGPAVNGGGRDDEQKWGDGEEDRRSAAGFLRHRWLCLSPCPPTATVGAGRGLLGVLCHPRQTFYLTEDRPDLTAEGEEEEAASLWADHVTGIPSAVKIKYYEQWKRLEPNLAARS